MIFFKGFSIGFNSFFKAIPFIFKNKLGWTFLIPIVLNIILYSIGFSLSDNLSNFANNYISNNWLDFESQSSIVQMLPNIIEWFIRISIQIIFFFIFAYIGGYIILILMSPVFAWISERTDQIINKTDYPFNMSQFFTDIWYGIVIALRNFLFELTVIILVMIATIIPIINIISGLPATIFLFIISAYFYGFSYIHYNLERRKFNAKESITFIKKHKGIAIANGMLFSLSLFIPFLGVMLSGITAIIATVGATIAINNIENIDDFKKIEEPKHKSTTNFKPLETNNKVLSNCTGRFVNYK